MKKWSFTLIIIVIALILTFIFQKTGLWKTMSAKDLRASIEIKDVETKWMEKVYQPWPPKLILAPAVSFRVKNLTKKPLRYINFNAIFKEKDENVNMGDCFLATIREEPLLPNETSNVILLKSNYGVEGKSLATFKNNPQWKLYTVTLYAQSKGSQYVNLGKWQVSRKIDFTEPEPVHFEKKTDKEGKINNAVPNVD